MGAGWEQRKRKGERACNHFFYDLLPPTFAAFFGCQAVDVLMRIFLKFQAAKIPYTGMSNFMSSETEFANCAVHPSKSCRFCKKISDMSWIKRPSCFCVQCGKKQRVIGIYRHGECSIS